MCEKSRDVVSGFFYIYTKFFIMKYLSCFIAFIFLASCGINREYIPGTYEITKDMHRHIYNDSLKFGVIEGGDEYYHYERPEIDAEVFKAFKKFKKQLPEDLKLFYSSKNWIEELWQKLDNKGEEIDEDEKIKIYRIAYVDNKFNSKKYEKLITEDYDVYFSELNNKNLYLYQVAVPREKDHIVFALISNKAFKTKEKHKNNMVTYEERLLSYFFNDTINRRPQPPNPFSLFYENYHLFDDDLYDYNYNGYNLIAYEEKNYILPREKSQFYQAMMTYAALANDKKTTTEFEKKWRPKSTMFPKDSIIQDFDFEKAIENQQVVMVNESHHHSNHRVAMKQFLPILKKNGFDDLFVEALANDSINERGYIKKRDGLYTNDPQFANMLRKAKQLGFMIHSYDSSGPKRDSIAAMNIYNKILKEKPNAKIAVYCGYSHIKEDLNDKWLAKQFHTLFNINPLTIDQVTDARFLVSEDIPEGIYEIDFKRKYNADYQLLNTLSFKPKGLNSIPWSKSYKGKFLEVFIKKEYEKENQMAVPIALCLDCNKEKFSMLNTENFSPNELLIIEKNKSGRLD